MSGTREPVRSKADGNGTQAATNAPVKEASVVFVSVRLPPLTLPLSLELEFQRARSSPRSDHRGPGTSRVSWKMPIFFLSLSKEGSSDDGLID